VTLAQAQADLDLVQTEIVREHPREDAGNGVRVVTLRDDVVRNIRTSLLILQGAVLIVVLIACANIANLLLARSTARRREIAIRSALGARKSRLVRQMLIESLLLGVIGGGGGLLLASWAVSALTALGASVVPELNDVAISVPVVAFAFGLSLVAGVIFGAAPAMHFSAERPNEALKAGGRAIGPSLADRRTRNWLVATEVAMSVVLLVCAGLLVKSFVLLQQVNPGFDAKGVIVADVSLPAVRYSEIPQQQEYFRSALRKAAELPGIESVALVTTLPESSDFDMVTMEIKGRTFAAGNLPNPDRYVVSPGYFHAFRIPLVRGRAFGADDDSGHPRVVIVNQQLADALFPGQDPIGQQVEIPTPGTFAPGQQPYWTIVGVVGNVKQYGLASNQTMQIYVPYLQYDIEGATLIGRAAQTPTAALVAELRRTVRAIDADVYVSDPQLMDEVLAQSLSSQRFSMALLTVFGVGALLLAMLGVYSVVSFVVAQRSAELGVRMALGAGAADVVRVVVVQGMRPVVAGLIAGAAIAFVAARLVEPFLFHTNPHDALASAIVVAVLATSAGVACSVPALRATRIDPLMALRAE
jgi:putative ABC transport system permease protein